VIPGAEDFDEPDFVSAEELFRPAGSGRGSTATAMPAPDGQGGHTATTMPAADQSGSGDATTDPGSDSDLVSARAGAGQTQSKRGRRSGEKPRMPSWDDILLGVRNKSD
jgi:hypothetical protein